MDSLALRTCMSEKRHWLGQGGGCPAVGETLAQFPTVLSVSTRGWLPPGAQVNMYMCDPDLNQFPHLAAGTLMPERPRDPSKDTQLSDARLGTETGLGCLHSQLIPTSPHCWHTSKAPSCHFFSVLGFPAQKRRRKCGRWKDGPIRSKCVDRVKGEKSMIIPRHLCKEPKSINNI